MRSAKITFRILLVVLMILFVILSALFLFVRHKDMYDPVVGGPCSYASFKGKCIVISIKNSYVYFKFVPTEPLNLSDTWMNNESYFANRTYSESVGHLCAQYLNSSYSFRQVLEKCGLRKGGAFNCKMYVEIEGTCTPLIFSSYK